MRRSRWLNISTVILMLAFFSGSMSAQGLVDRLHRANVSNSLDDPSLKPWHMKISFRIADTKTTGGDAGTVEVWWAAKDRRKELYSTANYSAVFLRNESGSSQSRGAALPPPIIERLLEEVIHPLPGEEFTRSRQIAVATETAGSMTLDCVALARTAPAPYTQMSAAFPTYCFDPNTDDLRLSEHEAGKSILRKRLAHFQGRSVAAEVTIRSGGEELGSCQLVTLEALKSPGEAFAAISGMEPAGQPFVELPVKSMSSEMMFAGVPGPIDIAAMHAGGTATMSATIGVDGRVSKVKLLTSTNFEVDRIAVPGVETQEYRPYRVNGEPVAVRTIISFTLDMGAWQGNKGKR